MDNEIIAPLESGAIPGRTPAATTHSNGASDDALDANCRRMLFLDDQGQWREGTAVLLPGTGDISATLRKLGYSCETFVEGYRDDDPGLELWSVESPAASTAIATHGNYLTALGGGLPRPLPRHFVRLCLRSRDYEVWIDRLNDALSQVERWLSIVALMRRIRVLDAARVYLDQRTNGR